MTISDAKTPTLPLDALHRRLGAVLGTIDGVADAPVHGVPMHGVPMHYGSVEDEARALRGAAGLIDRSWMDRLEMRGEDRRRFLNGQVTCDVKALEDGRLVYGFFTSRQGKVQADVTIHALDDCFRLELPAGRGEEIRAHLEKYILVDRVEIGPLPAWVPVAVVGPRSAEVLAACGLPLPEEDGKLAEGELGERPVKVARRPLLGLPACTLWLPSGEAPRLVAALLDRGAAAGVEPVGFSAQEIVRVEGGVPRFGADFGPDHFPQETGLEDEAVSYTKGCYLGQEVVARIHYRGKANRMLRGLVFEGEDPPAAGTPLSWEGREVGAVGTAVRSPALGKVIGLGILHRRAAEAGTALEPAGGGGATVHDLPFL